MVHCPAWCKGAVAQRQVYGGCAFRGCGKDKMIPSIPARNLHALSSFPVWNMDRY